LHVMRASNMGEELFFVGAGSAHGGDCQSIRRQQR
jgi:hypothetical protein